MAAEPLRIVGNVGDDPRLDLRPVSDLTVEEFCELIRRRFGIPAKGERVLELVFRNGRLARGHIHSTFTAAELEGDTSV